MVENIISDVKENFDFFFKSYERQEYLSKYETNIEKYLVLKLILDRDVV